MKNNFFQSEPWTRFQEANGHRVQRLEGPPLEGRAVVETLPLVGNFLYFPRGPVIQSNIKYQISNIKDQIVGLAHTERAGWVRVEPENEEGLNVLQEAFGGQLKRAPHPVQPQEVLVVPLEQTAEERLAKMKSKTRYNIRLAEKRGVRVRFSRTEEDITTFLDLIQATSKRKGISPHPKEYYRNFFTVFGEEECLLALAEHNRELLAAGLIIIFAGTAYYLHGGSSEMKRDFMAPFLLHFAAMNEAQRRGCSQYDFGGMATRSNTYYPSSIVEDWAGITRFKLGFAPDTPTTVFPGTFDIVFDGKRYALYRGLSALSAARKRVRKFLAR